MHGQARMLPIDGASKAKRLKWGNPQNHISWAYMKQLREHNGTRHVYDVNPYIEVYQFRENLFGLFNQNCDGAGDVWQWLVLGPEKAMLIDTAFGVGDMKGLCDELTGGLPLVVVNTHHHPDHAWGNTRFGEVHCHEYSVPYLESQNASQWDHLFDTDGRGIWLDFDRADLPKFKPFQAVGHPDGHLFDLGGGHEVELVWTPGHSAGHAMYLDKTLRILFAGDDICSDVCNVGSGGRPSEPFGEYANLDCFRDSLTGLVSRMDEFDYIFPAHFMVDLESALLPDLLQTVDSAIADPESYDAEIEALSPVGGPPSLRLHKQIPGFSTIAYTREGVHRVQ